MLSGFDFYKHQLRSLQKTSTPLHSDQWLTTISTSSRADIWENGPKEGRTANQKQGHLYEQVSTNKK